MLDAKTAFLMWSAQALTLSLLLCAVWLHDRAQRHYLLFCIGFALNSLGGISFNLRGYVDDIFTVYFSNCLVLLSLCLWANGLRLFEGRKWVSWPAIPAALWLVANLVPAIYASFANRLVVYALGSAIGYVFLASTLVSSRLSTPRYRHMLAGLWLVQSAMALSFALYGILGHPQTLAGIPFMGGMILLFIACMLSTFVLLSKIIMDRNEARLKLLSVTDPLTGALNRRGLIEAANTLKQNAAKDRLLALLVFDLDHFKAINDTHGHQVGDAVLSSFAEMTSSVIANARTHPKGLFGRSGGEEFCTLIPVESLRQAAGLAEQIRTMVANTPIVLDGVTVRLTVSIGISSITVTEFDFDKLMSQADHGLYKAKADGRNRTAIASGESVYCIGPGLEPGSPAAIDHDTDLQVAALRRLTKRQLHPDA
ncbi:diguanylate cyclase (GGDEF)-like protein [Agrobacterium vitis]|nr:diguanylate cyclase (GGDEF)-like protein [Agrobacterium vitis]